MRDKILVAIDFSDASLEALKQGHALATSRGGELAVIHVAPRVVEFQALFPQTYAANASALAEAEVAIQRELQRAVSQLGSASEVQVFVARGEAHSEIVRCAEAWSATLIIVGSQGQSGLARALLGRVAERAVRDAHCNRSIPRPSPVISGHE